MRYLLILYFLYPIARALCKKNKNPENEIKNCKIEWLNKTQYSTDIFDTVVTIMCIFVAIIIISINMYMYYSFEFPLLRFFDVISTYFSIYKSIMITRLIKHGVFMNNVEKTVFAIFDIGYTFTALYCLIML